MFSPGFFIVAELEARNWSKEHLSEISGLSTIIINDILNVRQKITGDIANKLGKAFNTSSELWLNLEASYQNYLLKT